MRLGDLLGAGTAVDIAECLFLDEVDGVALIDSQGVVLRANERFTALVSAGVGGLAWAELPTSVAALLFGALRGTRAVTLPAELRHGARRQVLRLALLPIPRRGGLLRISDHTREQDLEDRLAQAQRLQAVGELAGGIAHDFNNLLTAILGAADDLGSVVATGTAATWENLEQIRQSARRGAALVHQLLAFSRQQTLQPRVVSLNEAVRHAKGLIERLLGAGITIRLALEEPGRQIRIDPTQLDQVLVNLAVNAGHAMPQGGQLTISTGRRLTLKAETFGGETLAPGRYVSLSVSDTGSGIPPEILKRIFEPFFTTRREAGGTVRQSGGMMAVHSTPGAGTRFDILFPKCEGPGVLDWPADPPPPAPPEPRAASSVLLVEDEAAVRRLAERALRKAGWEVLAASCAEEALALADADRAFGCVVSDVVMPGMDGPALVRQLRQGRPGLPAVLMSGYADAPLREALAADDIVFLPKPFAMADLTAALGRLVAPAPAAPRHPPEGRTMTDTLSGPQRKASTAAVREARNAENSPEDQ
jgi:two-component system cell cycle sensor histidine kinase/response regulator CckA